MGKAYSNCCFFRLKKQTCDSPKSPALILKQQGNLQFLIKNHEKSIESYSQAIDLEPSNHFLYSNRSYAYLKFEKLDDALRDANKCIALQPEWGKGYERKAAVYIHQKEFDQAEAVHQLGMRFCTEQEYCR